MFSSRCGYRCCRILVGKFHYLLRLNVSAKIWVVVGTEKNYKYLNINSTCHAPGEQKSLAYGDTEVNSSMFFFALDHIHYAPSTFVT